MKKYFLQAICGKINDSADFLKIVSMLRHSYAKGYLQAKLETLLDYTNDIETIREEIQQWSDYDIWK